MNGCGGIYANIWSEVVRANAKLKEVLHSKRLKKKVHLRQQWRNSWADEADDSKDKKKW